MRNISVSSLGRERGSLNVFREIIDTMTVSHRYTDKDIIRMASANYEIV